LINYDDVVSNQLGLTEEYIGPEQGWKPMG